MHIDSYSDEIAKEQFIEYTTIRETINNIYDMLQGASNSITNQDGICQG